MFDGVRYQVWWSVAPDHPCWQVQCATFEDARHVVEQTRLPMPADAYFSYRIERITTVKEETINPV